MSASADDARLRVARYWLVAAGVGGALGIIGAILPWVQLGRPGDPIEVRNGIDTGGDGYITGALGALIVALAARAWLRPPSLTRLVGGIVLVAGFFLLSIPALRWADFRRAAVAVADAIVSPTAPEIGVYVTAVGGLLAIVGGWQIRRVMKRPDPKAQAALDRVEPKRY